MSKPGWRVRYVARMVRTWSREKIASKLFLAAGVYELVGKRRQRWIREIQEARTLQIDLERAIRMESWHAGDNETANRHRVDRQPKLFRGVGTPVHAAQRASDILCSLPRTA